MEIDMYTFKIISDIPETYTFNTLDQGIEYVNKFVCPLEEMVVTEDNKMIFTDGNGDECTIEVACA